MSHRFWVSQSVDFAGESWVVAAIVMCAVQDPDLHIKHLKPSPAASSIVNRCIECGFCESNCPSRDITLTPRQRITTYREISRLRDIDDRTASQQRRWGTCHLLLHPAGCCAVECCMCWLVASALGQPLPLSQIQASECTTQRWEAV